MNIIERGRAKFCESSFKTLGWIKSGSHDLLTFKLFSLDLTLSSDI